MKECDICNGRRTVRLPVYQSVVSGPIDADISTVVDQSSREYPCPECASDDRAPVTRLQALQGRMDVQEYLAGDVNFMRHAGRNLAARLGVDLFERGLIEIAKRTYADEMGRNVLQVRATVAAFSPNTRIKLEQRVAERQLEVAAEVVDATIEEIANWGSFYHGRMGGRVDASQAVQWLRDALKRVRERRNG